MLTGLKLKPSGREMLARPVLFVAERGRDYHQTPERPRRQRLGDSSAGNHQVQVVEGPLATVVQSRGKFYGGGEMLQTIRFYADDPRIDFEVTTEKSPPIPSSLPNFPWLARSSRPVAASPTASRTVRSVCRSVESGLAGGIMPAIRWSDYALAEGGGVTILTAPARP